MTERKLFTARLLQCRDLSDSTVRRTFGLALGHTLLAWKNLVCGLQRISANEEKIRADLISHWEAIAEGAQMILRAVGRNDAYETLKDQTRGRVLTEADYRSWLETLEVNDETRAKLQALDPEQYVGIAIQICAQAIEQYSEAHRLH